MDHFLRLLLRMAYWVHHPPSKRMLAVIAAAVVFSLAIFAIEWLGYWPDALSLPPRTGLRYPIR
ncbi:hypothetical protein [Microbaculum marinum]|uniref:Uncharacterized protein n=1 Tax=Microbaculum marinum TaxID=1764581 RepID=A0AAW9RUW0_9HYPH